MIETNEVQVRAVFLEWYSAPSLTKWADGVTPQQKAEVSAAWFVQRLADLRGPR